jgi:hypothetical protein
MYISTTGTQHCLLFILVVQKLTSFHLTTTAGDVKYHSHYLFDFIYSNGGVCFPLVLLVWKLSIHIHYLQYHWQSICWYYMTFTVMVQWNVLGSTVNSLYDSHSFAATNGGGTICTGELHMSS